MTEGTYIDPAVPPSGAGCAECLATDGWWFHLRRCAACGAHRLLRLLAVAARQPPRRRRGAPDRRQLRAGRVLVL